MEPESLIPVAFCAALAVWILKSMILGRARDELGADVGVPSRWVPNGSILNAAIVLFCSATAVALALGEARPPALDLLVVTSLMVVVAAALVRDLRARRKD